MINYHKSAVKPIFKLNPSRYESDLSNEVLCSLVAQRAAKLLEVKVADLEKIILQIKLDSESGYWGQVIPFFFSKTPNLMLSNSTVL